jgi:sugar fermentation stimulation protein A
VTTLNEKLAYTWELAVNKQGHWIGINTNNANKLIAEALAKNTLPELSGYSQISSEVKYGDESSRVDFLLHGSITQEQRPDCYVEVKSVTLLQNNEGYFPDTKTLRGQKHLRELANMAKQGKRAVLLYCVQHTGIKSVRVAAHIDPKYAQELERAIHNGLQVLCYSANITKEKTYINQRVPFLL